MMMPCLQLATIKCGKLKTASERANGSQEMSMKLWAICSTMRTQMKKRASRTKMRMMTRILTKTMMMKKAITTFEERMVLRIGILI